MVVFLVLLLFSFTQLDFLVICNQKMSPKSPQLINTLITHGLDLISMLMSSTVTSAIAATSEEQRKGGSTVKKFLLDVAESVAKLSESGPSSLLLLKNACEVLMAALPDEHKEIQVLINYMTFFLTFIK